MITRFQRWAPTWLAQMPGLLSAHENEELQRDIVGATKERMLRELVGVPEALSQELPLVMVLEDLHWSDAATLDAISLLAQRRDLARLLVIGTYRPVDAAIAEHPVKRLRQDLLARGRCIELPLAPFSRLELAAFLAVRFPGNSVPEAVVKTVYDYTEGHPLFVANLFDEWTVQDLIRLPEARRGWGDRMVAGWDSGRPVPFSARLYQEVLYQRLPAAQRVRIHKRLAERLAVAYGEQSHRVAAELADHFERGCEYARALRYLGQAAENAARRYANREAVAYLSQALALVERLPPAEQEGTRVGLLQRRAHVRSVMDDLDTAIEDLKLVLRSGRERNDRELVVKTLVQISRLARWFDSRYCLETAAEAETVSREISDDLINACARVNYARVKLMLNFTGWRQESVATCRNGLGIIRKARDPGVLVPFLPNCSWVECMPSNYDLARLLAEEGAQTAQEIGDSFYHMLCQWLQLWTMSYLGRLGEMRHGTTLALSVAEKNGGLLG